jgi:hypothetical protein
MCCRSAACLRLRREADGMGASTHDLYHRHVVEAGDGPKKVAETLILSIITYAVSQLPMLIRAARHDI